LFTLQRGFNMIYSAVYFNRARKILVGENKHVIMQVFQKQENTVLCGMKEALDVLKYQSAGPITVKSLSDGDIVQPWEPVLTIEGDLSHFVHLESVYLGILARASRVATNTRRCVDAANGRPVYFFGDRFDRMENQRADGVAAMVGGASAVCTEAMATATRGGLKAVGTMPHALIAAYDGNVVDACTAFRRTYPDVPLHALVDFNNNCVWDSLRCVREFGKDLVGVRLDTSENMIDNSIVEDMSWMSGDAYVRSMTRDELQVGDYKPTGVNAQLVRKVRVALDGNGGEHVKITVSGGFGPAKIAAFEKAGVPVDIYAVGSSIVTQNPIDFTADVVYPVAKAGRRQRDASRLKDFDASH
jgi:nicotinate phosphoribosyltransferase